MLLKTGLRAAAAALLLVLVIAFPSSAQRKCWNMLALDVYTSLGC